MQKGISVSRKLYKYAKKNKLFFCMSSFCSKFLPQTSFLMIQMTKDQFNESTLCIYYMLWNIDRKCSKKVVQKLLYSQYAQETCIKGAPFKEF